MLSRGVAGSIDRAKDPLLPFRQLDELLKSTDFNFGNLESPVSGNDNIKGKGLSFNAHTRDASGLKNYNFKVLNLANNHALDQRIAGLRYTRKYLEERGITHLGVGDNLDDAWRAGVLDVNGIKIGFLGASYASVNDGGVSRNDYVARIEDTERLRDSINALKSQADLIVVTMHAGIEYTRRPNQAQVDFAHRAIDAGADIIIGAHPHWVQTIEQYQGKYIFYSLGNFIFDQEWSRETKEGLVLKITLEREERAPTVGQPAKNTNSYEEGGRARIEQIELIPVIIERYSTPRKATGPEAKQILDKIELKDNLIKP